MIVGVAMVRDEEDVIGTVLHHLLEEGVDYLFVADNLSGDATPLILKEMVAAGAPLSVIEDPEPGYRQSEKMTWLATQAWEAGAEWVLPFDADEIWYAPGSTIGEALRLTAAGVVAATGFDHLPRPGSSTIGGMPFRRLEPQRFKKVAFRARADVRVAQGNHSVEHPGRTVTDVLEFRHFQWRTLEQMARKVRQGAAAYLAAPEIPVWEGAHWRTLAALTSEQLAAEWDRLCDDDNVVYDPAPIR